MKYKIFVSALAVMLMGTAMASENLREGDREEVKVKIKKRETHVTFQELCDLFEPYSHPEVFPLFREGFGVLFENQQGRLSPKRENSHIACLYDDFRVLFERHANPTESEEVKESQKIQLLSRFDLKGHQERFASEILNKLQ